MPYILPQPVRESAPYVFHKDLFSREECQKIIDLHKSLESHTAMVGGSDGGIIDHKKRRTEVFWIDWNSEREWIFSRIAEAVSSSNAKFWGYHLSGLNEPLQLTHYRGDDKGFYDWHEDHGDKGSFQHRKLSAVVVLNEGFSGGNFELNHIGSPAEMTIGTLIIFPSFKLHRVTPVTEGERWSLVSWVNGPPFV
jgi:PKHD-type hydroxylase